MAHLKRKFVHVLQIPSETINIVANAPTDTNKIKEIHNSNLDQHYAFLVNKDEMVQSFKFVDKANKRTYLIGEPNPIVMYFDMALGQLSIIKERRNSMMRNAKVESQGLFYTIEGITDFYNYYTITTSLVIYLSLALEAFINKIIPDDFIYYKKTNKKTEMYNRDQIQRYIDFQEKLKSVVTLVTSKDFAEKNGHKFDLIKKLKGFRDEIVHTKSQHSNGSRNYYEQLFSLSLSFDYEKTLQYCADYINFYEPKLIEYCNCD